MDTEFTMNKIRYATDCDTYRVIFELLETKAGEQAANKILQAGLKLGEIKEV